MSHQGPHAPLIASQNDLDELPFEKWAQSVGVLNFPGPTGPVGKEHTIFEAPAARAGRRGAWLTKFFIGGARSS